MAILKSGLALSLVMAVAMVSCATAPEPSVQLTRWRTVLVTATGSGVPGVVEGVSDKFTFNGRIHAHATLVAETPVVAFNPTINFKWLNAGKVVHERSGSYAINGSPYYLMHALPGSVVGIGAAKVEVYVDGRLVAMREFTVSER